MRPGLHPQLKKVTVILANGASVEILSCVDKFRNIIQTTVDPSNHHLWTGKKTEVAVKGRRAKFASRYAGIYEQKETEPLVTISKDNE
mmetsp:Transcript_38632/g.53639  ORF Transcript_38632/g.53639 Transcript_38632/m.53639 type:complete len:88 (-) Transcript_38632:138-401(-)|eukprot:CAMPEP_0196575298 /NCGR_PEP_ID=MMETSP1081-20130531/4807_1 /TAXON_ID=36882 /ORGANISM="Pyramimonas amylifera, Strain CCMP720" /LENGTH=87 /DNA_ID=CAMNT_0041893553 /DNA_START=145 /DNA_END=408 /DNA_ORIENTATION=-